MWLGDIDDMDDKTKGILKSFNVPSDHLLIDSEFYQGQMKCVFSEPIIEKRILINKEAFISNIKKKHSVGSVPNCMNWNWKNSSPQKLRREEARLEQEIVLKRSEHTTSRRDV